MKTVKGEYLLNKFAECQFLNQKLSDNAFCFKLRCHNLALMSFTIITSPLQDTANEPRWRNFSNFKVIKWKKEDLTNIKNAFRGA